MVLKSIFLCSESNSTWSCFCRAETVNGWGTSDEGYTLTTQHTQFDDDVMITVTYKPYGTPMVFQYVVLEPFQRLSISMWYVYVL